LKTGPKQTDAASARLLAHVAETISRRKLLKKGEKLLVAVSGGLDSMVLLDLLNRLSAANGWRLHIAHLNHCLRGRSSDLDQALVENTCRRLRLPFITERAKAKSFAEQKKVSIEMAARELRHAFFRGAAARTGASAIALAHHADDQVELFFLRLFRGSSSEGLGGMKWSSAPIRLEGESSYATTCRLVRPLLDIPKEGLKEYAQANKVPFREDKTNACLDIQRNRIRHELLPLLKTNYQPGLEQVVLRVMDVVGTESACVGELAKAFTRGLRNNTASRAATKPAFDSLPVAVQRQAIQIQLWELGITPDYDLIEQLRVRPGKPVCVRNVNPRSSSENAGMRRTLTRAQTGAGGSLTNESGAAESKNRTLVKGDLRGTRVVRDQSGRIRLAGTEPLVFSQAAAQIGITDRAGAASFGGLTILWQIMPTRGKESDLNRNRSRPGSRAKTEAFDADQIGNWITLRHWQPGDRFQPIGMTQAVKLQDLFTNAKVPAAERRTRVLACAEDGAIFWVEGLRISEQAKVTANTSRSLLWRWKRPYLR
jgi:tRNA(Ile)-lysidine synthase